MACALTKESNTDLIFQAAKNGDLKKEIIFMEKAYLNNQYCTIVYGL